MGEIRFAIEACAQADIERLERELGVSAPVAQVLVRRGFGETARARAFIAAEEEHPYTAFAGIERAIATILAHVERRTRITVHGDYDVDGICSSAVLIRALRRLGADVDWYLPDRAGDGYGLKAETVRRLAARGTKLLVTADCAITAVEEVAQARELGIDVVVTDHHSPRADGLLPDAPIVHPTVCGYPCEQLCATAVAYKLAEGLEGRPPSEDLDLVALATIADVVPLLGESRTLTRRGLRALASTSKPGLRALMSVAKVEPGKVNERAVGFGLAPRLNAAGRLYRADAGLELILTEDRTRAAQVADELDRANRDRRGVELQIRIEAESLLEQLGERHAYVLAGEGWHVGVIGIVASRLAESLRRPVVLIALDGERGRGSGRAGLAELDLLAGLTSCAEHLVGYGGHRAAAGLEIERAQVEQLAGALDAYAARALATLDTTPVERVDAVVAGGELGMALAEELRDLAPFGQGNPTVSLLVSDATFADVRPMGEGRHARFTVRSPGGRARAVAFGNGGSLGVAEDEPVEATFTLEVNEWNGVTEPRLVLRHAQPASERATLKPCPMDRQAQPALFPVDRLIVGAGAQS